MANATTSRPARDRCPGRPPPRRDWPAQAADTIERVVGAGPDKTTGPGLTGRPRRRVRHLRRASSASRPWSCSSIGAVRLIDGTSRTSVFGDDHVWAAYLIIGLVFVVAGLVLWVSAGPPGRPHTLTALSRVCRPRTTSPHRPDRTS